MWETNHWELFYWDEPLWPWKKIVCNFPELDNLSAIITFSNIDNDFLDNLAYDDMVNVATDKP